MKGKMVEKGVTAHPYADQYGTIMVPEEIADDAEKTWQYVEDHFDDIEFGKPDLDYAGTEFEVE